MIFHMIYDSSSAVTSSSPSSSCVYLRLCHSFLIWRELTIHVSLCGRGLRIQSKLRKQSLETYSGAAAAPVRAYIQKTSKHANVFLSPDHFVVWLLRWLTVAYFVVCFTHFTASLCVFISWFVAQPPFFVWQTSSSHKPHCVCVCVCVLHKSVIFVFVFNSNFPCVCVAMSWLVWMCVCVCGSNPLFNPSLCINQVSSLWWSHNPFFK